MQVGNTPAFLTLAMIRARNPPTSLTLAMIRARGPVHFGMRHDTCWTCCITSDESSSSLCITRPIIVEYDEKAGSFDEHGQPVYGTFYPANPSNRSIFDPPEREQVRRVP